MNIIRIKKYNYEYLNGQVNILTKNSNELKKEIELNKEKLINKNKAKKRELVNKYGSNVEELFTNEINEIINDNTEIWRCVDARKAEYIYKLFGGLLNSTPKPEF